MEKQRKCLVDASLYGFPAAALLVAVCVRFLDEPVALAVGRLIRSHPLLSRHAKDLPDLLLPAVVLLSAGMWIAYFRRVRGGVRDDRSRFHRLAGTALPAAYLAKAALKFAFGRINTRVWLDQPTAHAFLWFHGGEDHSGFPSGHMTVFAAFAAAYWVFIPRGRPLCLLLPALLGAALVVTDYHFLGDVVAGAYVGPAVVAVTCRVLEGRSAGAR